MTSGEGPAHEVSNHEVPAHEVPAHEVPAHGGPARAVWRWLRGPWSLRRRLLVVLAALVAVGLVVADTATYRTLRTYLLNREDAQLNALAHGAVSRLLPELAFGQGTFTARGNFLLGTSQAFIQLRDPSGQVLGSAQAHQLDQRALAPPQLPARLRTPSAGPGLDPTDAATYLSVASTAAGEPPYRVRVSPVSLGGGGGLFVPGNGPTANAADQMDMLVLAVPLTDMVATLHKLFWTEVAVSLAAVALALAGGAWMVRVGLRPLEAMADTADEIAAGRLDRRVDASEGTTEVGRLGTALNSMLGRIEAAFSQKEASEARLRRFVADASHELRTPLTSIRGYAELFRRGADRRPDDLAKVMTRIEAEATRMGFLVEDLLLLARLDQGRPLETSPVDLRAVVAEAVDAARAVEPDRPMTADLGEEAEVVGDRNRLRQVVDNLLANVRLHTPPGAPATVRLSVTADRAVLEVDDTGPGLDSEAAPRVFERFFRADPSRSQDTGGAGLGLSIVQAITEAHGGTVTARTRPEGGASFVVTLPLAGAGTPPEPTEWLFPGPAGPAADPGEEPPLADVFGAGDGPPDGNTNGSPRIGSGRSQG